jgi:hypothetical protein
MRAARLFLISIGGTAKDIPAMNRSRDIDGLEIFSERWTGRSYERRRAKDLSLNSETKRVAVVLLPVSFRFVRA